MPMFKSYDVLTYYLIILPNIKSIFFKMFEKCRPWSGFESSQDGWRLQFFSLSRPLTEKHSLL